MRMQAGDGSFACCWKVVDSLVLRCSAGCEQRCCIEMKTHVCACKLLLCDVGVPEFQHKDHCQYHNIQLHYSQEQHNTCDGTTNKSIHCTLKVNEQHLHEVNRTTCCSQQCWEIKQSGVLRLKQIGVKRMVVQMYSWWQY